MHQTSRCCLTLRFDRRRDSIVARERLVFVRPTEISFIRRRRSRKISFAYRSPSVSSSEYPLEVRDMSEPAEIAEACDDLRVGNAGRPYFFVRLRL